jgi:hypothetical protein
VIAFTKVKLYLDSPDFPSVDALQMAILSSNYLLISNCVVTVRIKFRIGVRVRVKLGLGLCLRLGLELRLGLVAS